MRIIVIIILLFIKLPVFGQEAGNRHLLQTKSNTHLFYVDLDSNEGKVYEMEKYLDKAGIGFTIRSTDTVTKQTDGIYYGKKTKIVSETGNTYLTVQLKKQTRLQLEKIKDLEVVNSNLNNAYFVGHYFEMNLELNRMYPLNHFSFRNALVDWRKMPSKEIDYLDFKEIANRRLKEIKDSITEKQNSYVAITNHLVQNIKTLDYNNLKDSLVKLPAEYKSQSWYYGTVINELAKQKPEYFFKLAEDFPNNRSLIFYAVANDKVAMAQLKAVEGYTEIKKALFKEKKV